MHHEMQKRFFIIIFALALVGFIPVIGQSAVVEQLVMPGELIRGHAKYEKECERCHEPFSKTSQKKLCLDCHKDVNVDIRKGTGFHGISDETKETECKHCHTDHEGRNVDIVRLDKEIFDHNVTDFKLKGQHLKASCIACHVPKTKYREASLKCIDCHKKADTHKGNLGEVCADCHVEKSWSTFQYDHNKTKFPLKGIHQQVACRNCHPDELWKNTPIDCFSCHRLNDIHESRYSEKCEQCHTTEKKDEGRPEVNSNGEKLNYWKYSIFDHDKTKFSLKDKHIEVACDKCHPGKVYEEKLGVACFPCHKNDDLHKGRYGAKCETCHNQKKWQKSTFDHAKTKFPLKDKHIKVSCDKCHTGPTAEQKLGLTCNPCHRLDDVHQGRYGEKCETCHIQKEWKKSIYDHAKTKFPLKDKHIEVACDKCHPGIIAEEKQRLTCAACHLEDDVHKGQIGKKCERCHNQSGWTKEVFFDHDLARLPLIGIHAITPCEECHLSSAYEDTPMQCNKCHGSDDLHKLRLGPQCELCHNPNSWALWEYDHNTQSKYVLDGAHEGLECHACHKTKTDKEIRLSNECYRCHLKDDVHFDRFGKDCGRCHITKSFKDLKKLQ
jgi:hypothetical protein